MSFIAKIFKKNKTSEEEKIENSIQLKENWEKSNKSLADLSLLINIEDNNFISEEFENFLKKKKLKKISDLFEFISIISRINVNTANQKLLNFLKSAKIVEEIFRSFDNKEKEINLNLEKFYKKNFEENSTNSDKKKNKEIKGFNFAVEKFVFSEDNNNNKISEIFLGNESQKLDFFMSFVTQLIKIILKEEYFINYFPDYFNFIKNNFNESIQEIINFAYEKLFEIFFPTKTEYFDYLIKRILNLNNKENNPNCEEIYFLLPNSFNKEIIYTKNFFAIKVNLETCFLSNKIKSLSLSDEYFKFPYENNLENLFLNFLTNFEDYLQNINEDPKNLNISQTNKITFLDFFNFFGKIKSTFFQYDKENLEFIKMEYFISLYKIIFDFNFPFANDSINLNLESFLLSDLDKFISEEILHKKIFREIEKNENKSFEDFLVNLFNLIYFKNSKLNSTEKSKIEKSYIYPELIKNLPFVIFLKLIKLNSPAKILFDFLNSLKISLEESEEKNENLQFICFFLIQNTIDTFADKAENYLILAERFEMINKFFPIENLIKDLNHKFLFLETVNKKLKTLKFSLKDLIFSEENLKTLLNDRYKKELNISFDNFLKEIFSDEKKFDVKIFEILKEFYTVITNKFSNSKGIGFFELNKNEIGIIEEYLNTLVENYFIENFQGKINFTNFEILINFILCEKLGKYSLDILLENVKFYF